ncbi:UNVERIFIED_CONTAM: hypothetical protein Slati_2493200 [Sesamum latifolium]|uniref:Uncharacterized protein n=1 Tax=Sesamum latifolium TaxID=2727402 RepID=A0AAW2WI49_9LAMI
MSTQPMLGRNARAARTTVPNAVGGNHRGRACRHHRRLALSLASTRIQFRTTISSGEFTRRQLRASASAPAERWTGHFRSSHAPPSSAIATDIQDGKMEVFAGRCYSRAINASYWAEYSAHKLGYLHSHACHCIGFTMWDKKQEIWPSM